MRSIGHNTGGCVVKAGKASASALVWTLSLLAAITSARAQSLSAYEVATINPPPPPPFSVMGIMPRPDGIHAENVTLQMLVRFAYGDGRFPTDDRVIGAPDWGKSERFNIDAKMSEADIAEMQKLTPKEQDARREVMLQALVVDRFKLKTHFDTKQAPVYELVIAKGGPKLKESKADDEIKGPTGKGIKGSVMFFSKGQVRAQNYTTKNLVNFLAGQPSVGRPVIDKTGLMGSYSFELNMAIGRDISGNDTPGPGEGISVFTALQDDLGLKLQSATGPVETVVIDHVEHPTEN